jgi:hypothetical protein
LPSPPAFFNFYYNDPVRVVIIKPKEREELLENRTEKNTWSEKAAANRVY